MDVTPAINSFSAYGIFGVFGILFVLLFAWVLIKFDKSEKNSSEREKEYQKIIQQYTGCLPQLLKYSEQMLAKQDEHHEMVNKSLAILLNKK